MNHRNILERVPAPVRADPERLVDLVRRAITERLAASRGGRGDRPGGVDAQFVGDQSALTDTRGSCREPTQEVSEFLLAAQQVHIDDFGAPLGKSLVVLGNRLPVAPVSPGDAPLVADAL